MIVSALCWIAAAGLVVVGILAQVAPKLLARNYGLAVEAPYAIGFVRAAGARDRFLRFMLGAAIATSSLTMDFAFAIGGLALSLADLAISFYTGGRRVRPELGAHIAGAVLFAVILALLARSL
jgi:hypothetical protein